MAARQMPNHSVFTDSKDILLDESKIHTKN